MENIVKKKTAKQLFVVSAVMLATCGSFYGMEPENLPKKGSEEGFKEGPEKEVVINANHVNDLKDLNIEKGGKEDSICNMCCCCDICLKGGEEGVPIKLVKSYKGSEGSAE